MAPATSFQLQQPHSLEYSYDVDYETGLGRPLPLPGQQGSVVPTLPQAISEIERCGAFQVDDKFRQSVTDAVMASAYAPMMEMPTQGPQISDGITITAPVASPAPHRTAVHYRPLPVPQGPRLRPKPNAAQPYAMRPPLPPTPPLQSPRPRSFIEIGSCLAGGGGCDASHAAAREDARAVSPVVEMLEGMVS